MLILKFGIIYALGALISFTLLIIANTTFTDFTDVDVEEFILDTKEIAWFSIGWPLTSLILLLTLIVPYAKDTINDLLTQFAIAIYRRRK